jgi:hypothetical protein
MQQTVDEVADATLECLLRAGGRVPVWRTVRRTCLGVSDGMNVGRNLVGSRGTGALTEPTPLVHEVASC